MSVKDLLTGEVQAALSVLRGAHARVTTIRRLGPETDITAAELADLERRLTAAEHTAVAVLAELSTARAMSALAIKETTDADAAAPL